MKTLLMLTLFLSMNAIAAIGPYGEVRGKVVGMDHEKVTVLTTEGQQLVLKRDLIFPKGDLKVNQKVTARIKIPSKKKH